MEVAPAVTWATRSLGGGWSVGAARTLPGGITGTVLALELHNSSGSRRRLVLKLYLPDPSEPDSAWREAHILRLLAGTALPVPRLIAIDRDGAEAGVPALLMTRMPGRRRMRPRNTAPWLSELARLAKRIHATTIPHEALPRYRAWGLDDPHPVPAWWTNREAWNRAVEVFQGPAPQEPLSFIHRDFHPGNVLWQGARPAAIVDWLHGCIGPVSVDIAHCKLNVWLDFGPEIAERWTDEYRPVHPYWEIADALSWTIEPVADGLQLARRYESFLNAAVARLP